MEQISQRNSPPVVGPRRLFLRCLQEIDLEYDECNVRLLEMIVDGLVTPSCYSQQFWYDVETYGLSEAVIYLKQNFLAVDYSELDLVCKALIDKYC